MLAALCGDLRVEASQAERSQDYQCPSCGGIVHVRRRKGWVTHFFHLVRSDCASGGEGARHMLCKVLIGDEYRKRGYDVAYEWSIADELQASGPRAVFDSVPNRRTDVMIWRKSVQGVRGYAIEIQDSHIEDDVFLARQRDWESFGVRVLWLSVASHELSKTLQTHAEARGDFVIERYPVLPFERLVWRLTGAIWFVVPEASVCFKARPAEHMIVAERFGRFDHSIGDFVYVGGYEYPSKRFVDLRVSPAVAIADLKINAKGKYATWQ